MSTVLPVHEETSDLDRVRAFEREYLLQNYARFPLVIHRGKGCYVYDTAGKRYLDLIAGIGVNALGYAHPRLTKVIREQAGLLLHISNLYYHEYQGPLAERIVKVSGLNRVFFANSGAESMEGALKMVRAHGRKSIPPSITSSRSKTPSTAARSAPCPSPARKNTAAILSRWSPEPTSFRATISPRSNSRSMSTPPESSLSSSRAKAAFFR